MRDHSHPPLRLLAASLVVLALLVFAGRAEASTAWQPADASWYGPGFMGNRTACGNTLTTSSWWVASLKPDTARCGLKVRICHPARRRCIRITVRDRGAWRSDRRRWDLTARPKYALRCPSVCRVVWRRGW